MRALTPKQRATFIKQLMATPRLLLVIQDCQAKGFTPTIGELMEAFQLSKNSITHKLAALERNGYIKRQRKPRRITILRPIAADHVVSP